MRGLPFSEAEISRDGSLTCIRPCVWEEKHVECMVEQGLEPEGATPSSPPPTFPYLFMCIKVLIIAFRILVLAFYGSYGSGENAW